MKLKDIVEVSVDNSECVVLKVKDNPDSFINLISLGCFDGNETMFRLTKGRTITCTVWKNNGKSFSWHWGYGGYTLVTEKVDRMGEMIQHTIENDFGIKCKY